MTHRVRLRALATQLLLNTAQLYAGTHLVHNIYSTMYHPREVLLLKGDAIMYNTATDRGAGLVGLSSSSTIFQLWGHGHIMSPESWCSHLECERLKVVHFKDPF